MKNTEILAQIRTAFDTRIYNGYNQCSHKSLHYAEAMFELAKEIDMLDEFDVNDWQFEINHLRDYVDAQSVRERERMKWRKL